MYYEHGPILNKKIVWPSQNLNNIVKFKLFDLNNSLVTQKYIDNEWALFKLIDDFTVVSKTRNEAIYKYSYEDYSSSFLIKGAVVNMLNKHSTLSNFHLNKGL